MINCGLARNLTLKSANSVMNLVIIFMYILSGISYSAKQILHLHVYLIPVEIKHK